MPGSDPDAGLGLACGFNGLVAADVDDPRVYAITREIFGPAHAPVKVGRKGGTGFFCGVGIPARKFVERAVIDQATGKAKRRPLVEILSVGSQTVCPPTVHPDTGKPYRWVSGSLEEIRHPSELPAFKSEWLDELERALAPLMEPKKAEAALAVTPKKLAAGIPAGERKRYEGFAWAALKSECADLAGMSKPGRNDAVFRIGCLLGRWVWHGILRAEDLESAVKSACEMNGLTADNTWKDVLNTLNDGLARAANDSLPILTERPRTNSKRHARGAEGKRSTLIWNEPN